VWSEAEKNLETLSPGTRQGGREEVSGRVVAQRSRRRCRADIRAAGGRSPTWRRYSQLNRFSAVRRLVLDATVRKWSLSDNRSMMSVHPRITIEPDKRDGKPCIRGMRITVNDVLGWLAHGMTEEEILEEHPGLEKEDFAAVYAFAADVADTAYGGR
jgi:uncharacterized protein (DUF433 family)